MSETLEYIEAYFTNELSDAEKQAFEQRCASDENFADDVAFYITSRQAIRQELLNQKTQLWSGSNNPAESQSALKKVTSLHRSVVRKWLPYAAAACVMLFALIYFFYPKETPKQLAGKYVKHTLTHISQTMDGSRDSLQKGISFYNSNQYDSALHLFQNIYQANPGNSDAKQYIGLAYLMKKDYEKALMHFDELANKKLFSNAGVFLKAVTLLQRDNKGDKEAARDLLKKVKDENLEGRTQAEEWLSKW
jgi:tetratricopeptide (TPR) repeat protein